MREGVSGKWQKIGPVTHTHAIWLALSHLSQIVSLHTHDEGVFGRRDAKIGGRGGIERMDEISTAQPVVPHCLLSHSLSANFFHSDTK